MAMWFNAALGVSASCGMAQGAGTPMQETWWELQFEHLLGQNRATLYISARQREGAWMGGIANSRGLWNTARYVCDLSQVTATATGISGTLKVTLVPDPWSPKTGGAIECALAISAQANATGQVQGRYEMKGVSPANTGLAAEGKVSGTRQSRAAAALPDPVTVRLLLEPPAAGMQRMAIELGFRKGKLVHSGVSGVNARHLPHVRTPMEVAPDNVRLDPNGIRGNFGVSFENRKFQLDFQGVLVEPYFVGWYARKDMGPPGPARASEAPVPGELEKLLHGSLKPSATRPDLDGPVKGVFHGDLVAGIDETFLTRFRRVVRDANGPVVQPWKSFAHPDPAYIGDWFVGGDLDGDGKAEFVTARNSGQNVTAMTAFRMDGSVMWRWGRGGEAGLSFDVPVQLFDLDGDGACEVYASSGGSIVVLEGKTGKELRRWPLPRGLGVADCITFVDLRGQGKLRDIIVKTRYSQLWAYTDEWKPLWTWRVPSVTRTCHHPTPVDIDGHGKDEIIAGFTLLDHDGRELWTIREDEVKLATPLAAIREDRKARPFGGHMDDGGVVRLAKKPADSRLAITFCNGEHIAMVDGTGKVLWSMGGHHFQKANAGWMRKDVPGPQIVSGGGYTSDGRGGVIWLFDADGRTLGEYLIYGYGRPQALLDWNGDGLMELVAGNCLRILDGRGRCIGRFGPESELAGEPYGPSPYVGDVDGDERPEVVLFSSARKHVWIYKGPNVPRVPGLPIGTPNFTLY